MFTEIDDVLSFEDGKEHRICIMGNCMRIEGEVKIVNSDERLIVCTDSQGNEQFFLSGDIAEQLRNKTICNHYSKEYSHRFVTPNALTYLLYNNKLYRAFMLIFLRQRLYYLALTINGLIKAFDAEEHVPLSRDQVQQQLSELKVNSFASAMRKQMYKGILML